VLQLIKEIIRAGQRYGIPVSLCGEMAADPMFTMLLLGLGLRIFSCAPPAIPGVKKVIRSTSMEQALQVARRVMGFDSDMETLNYLRAEIRRIMPEEFVE